MPLSLGYSAVFPPGFGVGYRPRAGYANSLALNQYIYNYILTSYSCVL